MKIICTTKRVINETTDCRKEFCCENFKIAWNSYKYGKYDDLSSNFKLNNNDIIELKTHNGYHGSSHWMKINYCPFCGTELSVKREKIDETGLSPYDPEKATKSYKKKHWWNK